MILTYNYSSFPYIPEKIRTKYSVTSSLFLRGFTDHKQDIDIFFNDDIPNMTTRILKHCTFSEGDIQLPDSFYWDLELGLRIECLLTIMSQSDFSDSNLDLVCVNPQCRKQIQVELDLQLLSKFPRSQNRINQINIEFNNLSLAFRKPTGFDQVSIMNMRIDDKEIVTRKIMQLLALNDGINAQKQIMSLPWHIVDKISDALSKADPLVNFDLKIPCPHCELEGTYKIDLERFVYQKLYQIQSNLINSIHKLAIRYHWEEKEILSIPHWRRLKYLSYIERDNDDND